MSAYIFGRVLYHPTLTTAQKITLAAIADVVNDHGFGWMLISTLRLKTSLSERGVQKALSELIEMDLLKRRVRFDKCSQFLINVAALPSKPAPNDREADLPEGWGAPGAGGRGAPHAGGGAHGAGGGAPGAPITLTEPGNDTDNPPLSTKGEPPQPENLFGELVDAPVFGLHDRVVEAWHALVKRRPGIADIATLNDSRKNKIAARAHDVRKVEPDPWKAWQRVIENIEANTYLCGEDPPGKMYSEPKRLDINEVLRPADFLKIFEGGYRANRTSRTHDPISGRRYGPAEQASRNAVAGIRASSGQHRDGSDGGGGAAADGAGTGLAGPLRSAFDQYRNDPAG